MPAVSSKMRNEAIWMVNQDEEDHELVLEILDESGITNPIEFFSDPRAVNTLGTNCRSSFYYHERC